MTMNNQNKNNLDNDLAALTDALLSGQEMNTLDELGDLDKITRQLHRLFSTTSQPEPGFRARLTRRLSEEWESAHARPSGQLSATSLRRRLTLIAAVLAIIIGVSFILVSGVKAIPNTGTILDVNSTALAVAGVVLAAVLVTYIIIRRRRD